jgi:hypothetical protein
MIKLIINIIILFFLQNTIIADSYTIYKKQGTNIPRSELKEINKIIGKNYKKQNIIEISNVNEFINTYKGMKDIKLVKEKELSQINKRTLKSSLRNVNKKNNNIMIKIKDKHKESTLIAYSSINTGVLVAYSMSKEYHKKNNKLITIYSISRINFLDMIFESKESICKNKKDDYKFPIIASPYEFIQSLAKENKNRTNNGMIYINCEDTKDDIYNLFNYEVIASDYNKFSGNQNIFKAESETEKGYTLNLLVNDMSLLIKEQSSWLSTYMYINNIKNGKIIQDKKITISTNQWTTGKSWNKTDHLSKTLTYPSGNSKTYNLNFTSEIQTFDEHSTNLISPNIYITNIKLLNILPSRDYYLKMTIDNHVTTHSLSESINPSILTSKSDVKTVSKKRGFNLLKAIVTIVVVVVVVYFTFGAGSALIGAAAGTATTSVAVAGGMAAVTSAAAAVGAAIGISFTSALVGTAVIGSLLIVGNNQSNSFNLPSADELTSKAIKLTKLIDKKYKEVFYDSGSKYILLFNNKEILNNITSNDLKPQMTKDEYKLFKEKTSLEFNELFEKSLKPLNGKHYLDQMINANKSALSQFIYNSSFAGEEERKILNGMSFGNNYNLNTNTTTKKWINDFLDDSEF